VATSLGLAPDQPTKDQVHDELVGLAKEMALLKASIGTSKKAATEHATLLAEYLELSGALGGDDPGRVGVAGQGDAGQGGIAGGPPADPPPGCTALQEVFFNATPVAIPATAPPNVVTSTISVGGMPAYLFDLNVETSITHTFNGDLDITLQSPQGTVVTLTTDNGGGNDNVFNGTFWGDNSDPDGQVPYTANDGMVTDATYVNLTVETPLVVEESLGAFIGEDPNGDWILTISDDATGDGGSLNSWSLIVTALNEVPVPSTATVSNTTPAAIAATAPPVVVTSTIDVAGLPEYLCDLDLVTTITHTFNGDLDITLRSPAGTIVTVTTDNGGGNDNVFNGTVWDDDANSLGQVPYTANDGLVTDSTYVNLTLESPLVPEESFAAFIGENPNGTWTLTISDDATGDGGSLDSWSLEITTCSCEAPCQVFFDKGQFDQFNQSLGKALKGIETFEESNIPDGNKQPLPEPIEGNTPNVDPGTGWGFPEGLEQKNIVIQTNVTPGPNPPLPNPSGSPVALYVVGTGFIGSNSRKVGEDLEVLKGQEASLDLIFTEPNHTGIGFELSHFDGFGNGDWIISVFNKNEELIGSFALPDAGPNEPNKHFFGVWCFETIGRINIWDEGIIPDAVDNIQMWVDLPDCPGTGNCFQANGTPGCNDPDCCFAVCAQDPFCCDTSWDGICANEAQAKCGNPVCGGPGTGPCNLPSNLPGCDDPVCCKKICLIDPFCCDTAWDAICVDEAIDKGCVPPPPPPNDDCADRIDVVNGTTPFTNVNATNDGPQPCGLIGSDVWYNYNSTINGTLTINTNGSPFDTVLAVYDGCSCPPGALIDCDDDDGDGLNSLVTFPVVAGGCYKIQVGGFNGAQGAGVLNITKEIVVVCPPNDNNCFQASADGSAGCNDPVCCLAVCEQDPFCCNTTWDGICANEAQAKCGFAVCGVTPNSCAEPHGQPGCSDPLCCKKVCIVDPFCCDVAWDALCVDQAVAKGCAEKGPCPEDIDGNGIVNVVDLVTLVLDWNCVTPPANKCLGDVNNDGVTDVQDLVQLILAWGPCSVVTYVFPIDGLQEVPPNPSPATGVGNVTLDNDALTLSWNITYQGLLGQITAAHFHGPAMPGQNAGVQVGIGALPSPMVGQANITAAQAQQILSGLWYVNIHSTTFPGGEIRGQVQ
jgi:subtilisin-like proprotein convertase family protein